jgi:YD repeat-containing protein
MKIQLRDLALILLLSLAGLPAIGQLFPQPQPYMYDRGYDAYTPIKGVKRMVLSRYIAGARFPNDWDVVVESYNYDKEGHLTQWNRYQNISGEATLQTSYVWAPEGHLLNETILLANDHSDIQRIYTWEKDAAGKYTKATIVDKAKKPIATLQLMPDGRYVHTETSLGNDKFLRSTYNANKRLMLTENTATGLVEEYSYDAAGMLAEVNVKNPNGAPMKIQYTNKLDDKGRVIGQTEAGRAAPKTYYFNYDASGHLIEKGITRNQPLELRGYDPMGRLTDILFFDTSGFSKEMLNITYETFAK